MKRRYLTFLSIALGCGGGESDSLLDADTVTDVSGWYDVVSAVAGPCGAPTTEDLGGNVVWIERLQNTFYVRVCTGTDAASCDDSRFVDLNVAITGGVRGEGGSAAYSAGCTLAWERTEVRTSTGGVTLTSEAQLTVGDNSYTQPQCNLESAAELTNHCSRETAWQLRAR